MSDLRERLIEALDDHFRPLTSQDDTDAGACIEAVMPIIETELQKRDREIERLKRRFGPAPRLGGS